jgi:putative heme-binding domain-containing protein
MLLLQQIVTSSFTLFRIACCAYRPKRVIVLVGLCWVSISAHAQEVNPLAGNVRAQYAGGVLFRAQCATCHGADATGIESIDAPDLTAMWRERAYSDRQVFDIIRDGIAGTIMPPHDFTETEVWMLVSFLRSVGESGVENLPVADSGLGATLFTNHCAECHRVTNTGGVLGPNLSDVLRRNSLADITASVRQPSALITSGYKAVRVNTNAGENIQGVLKNEDAFSFQIVDTNQQLRAFRKRDAALTEQRESLMPAFAESELSEQELLAILNYIQSATGATP